MDYKIGDEVVYGRHGVCQITDITERAFYDTRSKYYVLKPEKSSGAVLYVPIDNKAATSKLRSKLTPDEVHELLKEQPDDEVYWIEKESLRREQFRNILSSGNRKKLVKLYKTLYIQSKSQKQQGKKLHMTDERFFREVERALFEEICYAIDVKHDEVSTLIMGQDA